MNSSTVVTSFLICVRCECVVKILQVLGWNVPQKTSTNGKPLYQLHAITCIRCTEDLSTSLIDTKLIADRYYYRMIKINVIENSAAAWLIRKKYHCNLTCYNDTTTGSECNVERLYDILVKLKESYEVQYPIQCSKHKLIYTSSS